MATIPEWHVAGDWFDVCKCTIPCPCTFAQLPTTGDCEGVLAYRIREGHYGEVRLEGHSLVGVSGFTGNIWDGKTKAALGLYVDQRATEPQRAALGAIWGRQAGGFPVIFATLIGDMQGVEYAPISFEVAGDLAHWQAEIPGGSGPRGRR